MTALFEACGKCILTGEHFILYHTPALVLPWQSATFSLSRSSECTQVPPIVVNAWQQARHKMGLGQTKDFPFLIQSSIPLGCGFGSSAALCVALLKAAAEEAKQTLDASTLIAEATELEGLFHGRSSGLDPTIAVIQQPLHFDMASSWRPFAWRLDGYGFVLAVTQEERKTAEAVGKVRSFSEENPIRFGQLNQEMKALVADVEHLISAKHEPSTEQIDAKAEREIRAMQLGQLLSKNHRILSEVGVSSRGLDLFVETAMESGALGAKLTGAGLGGGMMALAPISQLPVISNALQQVGSRHCELCIPTCVK